MQPSSGLLDGAGESVRDRSLGRWHVVGTSSIPAGASSRLLRRWRSSRCVNSQRYTLISDDEDNGPYRLRVITAWQRRPSRRPNTNNARPSTRGASRDVYDQPTRCQVRGEGGSLTVDSAKIAAARAAAAATAGGGRGAAGGRMGVNGSRIVRWCEGTCGIAASVAIVLPLDPPPASPTERRQCGCPSHVSSRADEASLPADTGDRRTGR